MSYLPEIESGAIKAPKRKVKFKRRRALRKAGTNPRRKGTNPRAVAKKLWKEWYEATKFIREL